MPAGLDDVIKKCENLHVEEQHQTKILLQKYEHLFDGIFGECNMGIVPISVHIMDPNCKPVHARAWEPMVHGKIQIQMLSHGCQDRLVPDVFQNFMPKLVQDIEYAQTIILS
jgi:hypothetical protein